MKFNEIIKSLQELANREIADAKQFADERQIDFTSLDEQIENHRQEIIKLQKQKMQLAREVSTVREIKEKHAKAIQDIIHNVNTNKEGELE